MKFKYKKNVDIVVNLKIGETIEIKGFGKALNGIHVIEDIKLTLGTESGVSIKVPGYKYYLDSGWATKINQ